MTALALDIANRSAALFGAIFDALDKAIEMKKAVHPDNPSATDMKRIREIADTI